MNIGFPRLKEISQGRDNNLNLLRVFAAFSVLFSHSFALFKGEASEPLKNSHGVTFGSMAVDVFFILSGFLITISICKKNNILQFIVARVARIWPGLIVSVAFTVFVIGPLATSVGTAGYLASTLTWKCFFKCVLLWYPGSATLPGVFESNPYGQSANTSLWSLPWELGMYSGLAALWAISRLSFFGGEKLFKRAVILIGLSAWAMHVISGKNLASDFGLIRLGSCFFVGGAFFFLSDKIRIPTVFGYFSLVALLLIGSFKPEMLGLAWKISAPVLTFWLAFVPNGFIRRYNRFGDYSYGMYIYAWPVQQLVAQLVPNIHMSLYILFCTSVVLILSILSWHIVERPATRMSQTLFFKSPDGNSA